MQSGGGDILVWIVTLYRHIVQLLKQVFYFSCNQQKEGDDEEHNHAEQGFAVER